MIRKVQKMDSGGDLSWITPEDRLESRPSRSAVWAQGITKDFDSDWGILRAPHKPRVTLRNGRNEREEDE
jgi:hypothetical protein